jgi:hypothetical protein
MHFDGCRTSATTRPTLHELNTLLMRPHPCDRDYMHMSVPSGTRKGRMQVCSGVQGQKEGGAAYRTYALDGAFSTTGINNATFWMRTYDEASDMLHVGVVLPDGPHNNTLGFLGGEADASNPVLAGLASGDVRFFRCADRLACQMPEFTFGGARMDYRLDVNTGEARGLAWVWLGFGLGLAWVWLGFGLGSARGLARGLA